MPPVLRGEVVWADLNPVQGHEQAGIRPVLVLSSNRSNMTLQSAIILPITSSPQRAGFPYVVPIESVDMPRQPSWVLARQIRLVSTDRMQSRIGIISNHEMQVVIQALLHHVLPAGSSVTIADFDGLP